MHELHGNSVCLTSCYIFNSYLKDLHTMKPFNMQVCWSLNILSKHSCHLKCFGISRGVKIRPDHLTSGSFGTTNWGVHVHRFIKAIKHECSKWIARCWVFGNSRQLLATPSYKSKGQVQCVSFYACVCVSVWERAVRVTAQVSFPGSPYSLASAQCVKWPLRGGPVTLMGTCPAHMTTLTQNM